MPKAKTYTCNICGWTKVNPTKEELKAHAASHLDTDKGTIGTYSIFGVK